MAENVKGQPGGECGRLLCKCRPAFWRDAINETHICVGCAGDINRLYRMLSITEPCTEIVPDQAPAAATAAPEYNLATGRWVFP